MLNKDNVRRQIHTKMWACSDSFPDLNSNIRGITMTNGIQSPWYFVLKLKPDFTGQGNKKASFRIIHQKHWLTLHRTTTANCNKAVFRDGKGKSNSTVLSHYDTRLFLWIQASHTNRLLLVRHPEQNVTLGASKPSPVAHSPGSQLTGVHSPCREFQFRSNVLQL